MKWLKLSVKFFVIIIMMTVITFAQWTTISIDTLTTSTYQKRLTMQSLAIDNIQTLHAIWTERLTTSVARIYYSQKPIGSSWTVPQPIADSTSLDPTLAVEPISGKVHIAYTVSGAQYDDVCYATNRSGTWQRTRLTNNSVYDHTPTIAVNDSIVHIAWITTDAASAYKIEYAYYANGTWTQQILAQSQLGGYGTGAAPFISVSPSGVAHIVYRGGDYNYYHIHHAENLHAGDTTWRFDTLYSANVNDFSTAVIARDFGELFLACSGNDGWGFPYRTCYLHRPPNSVSWETYQLMTDTASASLRGMAMDGNFIHITWERISGNITTEKIYHCSNAWGGWLRSDIRTDGQTQYGALVIDTSHKAYCLVVSGPTNSQQVYCIHSRPMNAIAEESSIKIINFHRPYPNPSRAPVRFQLTNCLVNVVKIFALNGRLIVCLPVHNNQVIWNGVDTYGRKVPASSYICQYDRNVFGFVLIK